MSRTQTPQAENEQLAAYPTAIQESIRSEAETWFYGRIEPAIEMYESHRKWALILTPEQRRFHKSGAWFANQNLKCAAIGVVQRELGDPTD
ncbi:hypothetical protein [Kitasatospora sp. NBC_01300]|uniref:hypothetical protein n=1 Tax=Kitasatospora sp. NBC_01300 TaxID=2903574 RepID=UPI002F907F49|nr:hypothetical protein OG556_40900 [Kitasatospora sp. NBC_01300]